MVEQRSPKPTVEGSSPSAPAKHKLPRSGVFLSLPIGNFKLLVCRLNFSPFPFLFFPRFTLKFFFSSFT